MVSCRASVCPPPSLGAAREMRESVKRAGIDRYCDTDESGPQAQRAEDPCGEQVPTSRPMGEEVGRSQKGERKRGVLLVYFVFAFNERGRVK